jgi:predicted flap endonuclease-1-like 5' DNA nuclease
MNMAVKQFNISERAALLALKGVGPTVVSRLEQIGFHSISALRNQDTAIITKQISLMMNSTCWHNSPQARASIQAVVDLANVASTAEASGN